MKTLLFLKYIIYFLFTMNDRLDYQAGLNRGAHCYKRESGKGFLGQSTDYYYDPNRKPERLYWNWKEYYSLHLFVPL